MFTVHKCVSLFVFISLSFSPNKKLSNPVQYIFKFRPHEQFVLIQEFSFLHTLRKLQNYTGFYVIGNFFKLPSDVSYYIVQLLHFFFLLAILKTTCLNSQSKLKFIKLIPQNNSIFNFSVPSQYISQHHHQHSNDKINLDYILKSLL